MRKSLIFYCFMIFILTCTLSLGYSEDTGPVPVLPILKLSVAQSPLDIYPPVMIYTAQLSSIPVISTAALKVEFYHYSMTTNAIKMELLGTALVDKTGKAMLNKQIKPGVYTAVAKIQIGTHVIWSNKVQYTVR